jgi:hypothetical protein
MGFEQKTRRQTRNSNTHSFPHNKYKEEEEKKGIQNFYKRNEGSGVIFTSTLMDEEQKIAFTFITAGALHHRPAFPYDKSHRDHVTSLLQIYYGDLIEEDETGWAYSTHRRVEI